MKRRSPSTAGRAEETEASQLGREGGVRSPSSSSLVIRLKPLGVEGSGGGLPSAGSLTWGLSLTGAPGGRRSRRGVVRLRIFSSPASSTGAVCGQRIDHLFFFHETTVCGLFGSPLRMPLDSGRRRGQYCGEGAARKRR